MIGPKVKIGVTVCLTEDDKIMLTTTSKNKLTVLGLLESGKQIIMNDSSLKEEESLIERV